MKKFLTGIETTRVTGLADPVDASDAVTKQWTEDLVGNGGGGSSFLSSPNLIDDSDEVYFYWGWISVSGSWLIRRTLRTTALKENASITNNAGSPDLTTAWAIKDTLNYI